MVMPSFSQRLAPLMLAPITGTSISATIMAAPA
jgi:hypothetical protein